MNVPALSWNPVCLCNALGDVRESIVSQRQGEMLDTMMRNGEVEETAEERLWRAVIANTVEEWINGPLRHKREAEQFLFHDENDYRTVCFSAGINPEDLRDRLEKIRSRQQVQATTRCFRN